jgi:hypothetical protein
VGIGVEGIILTTPISGSIKGDFGGFQIIRRASDGATDGPGFCG